MKKALVFGAGGFIGSHMVNFLKSENYFVRGVDLKYPDFDTTGAQFNRNIFLEGYFHISDQKSDNISLYYY